MVNEKIKIENKKRILAVCICKTWKTKKKNKNNNWKKKNMHKIGSVFLKMKKKFEKQKWEQKKSCFSNATINQMQKQQNSDAK